MAPYSVVGKTIPRHRVKELVAGTSKFCSDVVLPGMLYGKILRSPYAHARILKIDTSRAAKLPGVKAVVTAKDMPLWDEVFPPTEEPPLARGKVRYKGEEVAAVAATDIDIAAEALDLIKVEYEELPAVFDIEEAMQPDAPRIHDQRERNIERRLEVERGDIEKGFAEADFIVEGRFEAPPQNQCCMETKTAVASFDASGKLNIQSTSTHIFHLRKDLAKAFGLPENKVRCVQALTVGGHFGSGVAALPVYYIAALLAKETGHPVRVAHTRQDDFLAVRPQMPVVIYMKMGVKRDGTFTAKQTKVFGDSGSYFFPVTGGILSVVTIRHESLYRFKNVKSEATLVFTNRVPTGEFRGFGNAQGHFAMESLIDRLAEGIGMDPAEIRLKNATRTGDISIHGWDMQSCGLSECIEKAVNASGWKRKRAEKQPNRGIGIACAIHVAGMRTAGVPPTMSGSAFVKLNDDGTVTLITGEGDAGQGASTVLSQICAEELGIPVEDVLMTAADTDFSPYCSGPYSSRTTLTGGNAVKYAAADARRQLLEGAAKTLEANVDELEIKDRRVYVRSNPEKSVPISTLSADPLFCPIIGKGVFIPGQPGSDPKTWYGDCASAYSFATDVTEVEVNTETGQVKVLKITAARDLGKAINPQSAEGQVQGGLAQGLGYSLTEVLEPVKGHIIQHQFADYRLNTALDIPEIQTILVESNEPRGPFGAKGVGELAMVPTAAAIANAIYDAIGIRIQEFPFTPERVLRALKEKAKS